MNLVIRFIIIIVCKIKNFYCYFFQINKGSSSSVYTILNSRDANRTSLKTIVTVIFLKIRCLWILVHTIYF